MGTTPRRVMSLDLTHLACEPEGKVELLHVLRGDLEALSVLMFEAYRGTIDDAGETLDDARQEVERTFAGDYGAMIWEASFVVRRGERIVASSLITFWNGAPLVSFVMTHPDAQGQGLAAALLRASAKSLAARGYEKLRLFVTHGNTRAERLYEQLGFCDVYWVRGPLPA